MRRIDKRSTRWQAVLLLIGLALTGAACSSAALHAPLRVSPTALSSPTERPSPAPTQTQTAAPIPPQFDGRRALQHVERQVAFGPRLPGSQAHEQFTDWLQDSLSDLGWSVEVQDTTAMDHPIRNVVAKRSPNQTPWIILGAHYDSRFMADRDPDASRRSEPVPGANDGASGVAVLLELARVLPENLDKQVWLVFFDAEDQGRIPGWDWILGSRAFVGELTGEPEAVIIVDMIGDADLNIYMEGNSDPQLTREIWQAAAELGYEDVFIPEQGYTILDDHTPFLEQKLRAINIIDFSYPYWHTTADTPDKVSAESLGVVGDTLLHWLLTP